MNRQLTKRVLFEKNRENLDLHLIKNNVCNFFSDVEFLSMQSVYNPNNFKPTKIILVGLKLDFEVFYLQEYLSEKERQIFLEEVQDDLSVKIWNKLEEEFIIKPNLPNSPNVKLLESFFIFLAETKNVKDYSFLKQADNSNEFTTFFKLEYNFMGSELEMFKIEHSYQVFSGIFNELYVKNYINFTEKKAIMNLCSIDSTKIYYDTYRSYHTFTISYFISYSDGTFHKPPIVFN